MTAMNASDFKAKCLDVLDRVGRREIEKLCITKHGRVVALLVPPPAQADALSGLHGFMRASVVGVDDANLTAPALDEGFAAAGGQLHY